jgi:ABC-type uncharacterized transport system substrate-binding protein
MRRREFITLLGGAAAWPLAVRAQQPLPAIGFLHSAAPDAYAHVISSFKKGLHEIGYVEGENVTIEYRWARDQLDQLPVLASELVNLDVNVLVAFGGTTSALAAKAVTTKVPIVFATGGDPVKSGLVTSMSRPTENVTGVTFFTIELGQKRVEVLHDLIPKMTSVGLLTNPANPNSKDLSEDVERAARRLGLQFHLLNARNANEIEAAVVSIRQERNAAIIVSGDSAFTAQRDLIADLARRSAIPTIFPYREAAVVRGLMSYGTSVTEAHRQAGNYAGRILKGAKPRDLPVMQSVKFELVINLKTAKALGLDVPPTLLARADEVIE